MKIGYATIDDVRSIVDTDVTDVEIGVLIDVVGAMMVNMVGSASAQVLRGICMMWAAYLCMLKDPASRRLGEYAEDRTATLKAIWEQVNIMITHATTIGGVKVTPAREELE